MKILFNRKSILFVTVLMFSAILIVFSSGSANAVSIWGSDATGELTGSRTSNDINEITANADWDKGGFVLSWGISFSGGLWTYKYNIIADRKEVSHFILEVTDDEFAFNIYEGTDVDIEGPKTWSAGPGEPNMPSPMYGIKFDFGTLTPTYTIVTDRAPVYGVFYAVDGKTGGPGGGDDITAWSKALESANYKTSDTLVAKNFIVRPDSFTPVPEPTTMLWLGTALFGLFMVSRKKFMK